MIINGDSLHELKELDDQSIDLVVTDPPYGYSFMGKDWDKAVPSVEIWQECLRVLKPGAFCFVMSAPRSDVQNAMISRLMEAGFRLDFTPIYWTYASGFPKAGNIGKLVDKRLGAEREVVGTRRSGANAGMQDLGPSGIKGGEYNLTSATSDQAKALDGSYAGFQPKPAVEVIIVAMKPLSEKTYVDQALKNGKGITWLDDCRIGTSGGGQNGTGGSKDRTQWRMSAISKTTEPVGRFPANLLVSDDVLNDGKIDKPKQARKGLRGGTPVHGQSGMGTPTEVGNWPADSGGSYSRYFDLDKWASTLPFLIVPKASKSEKNKGLSNGTTVRPGIQLNTVIWCETCDKKISDTDRDTRPNSRCFCTTERKQVKRENVTKTLQANHHPTVKPLKLMSYLITLGSRPGDTVLDPFVGSGTTVVAAKQLGREGIGIEREPEYADIARARVAHLMPQLPPEQPPLTEADKVLASEVIHNYHEQMRLI